MASISLRGQAYRVSIKRKGVRDSGTFDTYEEAEAWGRAREAEIDGMGADRETVQRVIRQRITLRGLLAEYVEEVSPTKKGGKRSVVWESRRAGCLAEPSHYPLNTLMDKPITALLPHHLGQWKSHRLQLVKPSTLAREKNFVSDVIRYAIECGYLDKTNSPFNGSVKFPSGETGCERDRGVSDGEIAKMLFAFGWDKTSVPKTRFEITALLWCISLETAMRLQEVQFLRVHEVDLAARVVRLSSERCKERRKKTLALSQEAVRLLKLGRGEGEEFWFDNTDYDVSAAFNRAKRNTTIGSVNGLELQYRDSRHRALTKLSEKLDPYELARQAGHNNLKRVMTYYRKTAESFVDKLD